MRSTGLESSRGQEKRASKDDMEENDKDEDIKRMGKTWKMVKELSRNGVRWRNFTEALCST
jgi:hypothetical protein